MIRILYALLLSFSLIAPASAAKIKEKPDKLAYFLARNPNAVELPAQRSAHARHFRLPNGTVKAILARDLNYVDGNGEWVPTRPSLSQTDTGYVLDGAPGRVEFVNAKGNNPDLVRHTYAPGRTVEHTFPRLSFNTANRDDNVIDFQFSLNGLSWTLRVDENGLDWSAPVPNKQPAAKRTYTFGLSGVGVTLTVDPDGNITGSDGYRLTRAVMVRTDGVRTPCSAWSISNGAASFTCDDSAFPAGAFPYLIDPTTSYTSTTNLGGYCTGSSTTGYPPETGTCTTNGSGSVFRYSSTDGFGTTTLTEAQTWVKYPTTSIPSNAVVSSATVYWYASSLYGNTTVCLSWENGNAGWIQAAPGCVGATAGSLYYTAPPPQWFSVSLTDAAANVQKGSNTGLHFSAASAGGFSTNTHNTPNASYLEVTYTVVGGQLMIVSDTEQ